MVNLKKVKNLRKVRLFLLLLWTVVMLGLVLYGISLHRRNIRDIARTIAISSIKNDLAYRYWAAQCGGVYVPLKTGIEPNPYLENIENRDVETLTGMKLTLVNPAYMVRLVRELAEHTFRVKIHITSLKLLRPENRPDAWEKAALQGLTAGKTDVSEITGISGKPYLRTMHRLLVRKKCLKCHAQQGYKAGDIRGGITANVPLQPLREALAPQLYWQLLIYLVIYLIGIVGIVFSFKTLGKDVFRIDRQNRWLRAISSSSFIAIGMAVNRVIKEVNDYFCEMSGYDRAEVLGKNTAFLYPDPKEFEKVAELYTQEKGMKEIRLRRKDGKIIHLLLATMFLDAENKSEGILFMAVDISARKAAERRLELSELKFRGMMEAISDPVYIGAPGREIEYMNPAMIARIGRDAAGEVCHFAVHGLKSQCPWCEELNSLKRNNLKITVKSPLDERDYLISFSNFASGKYPESKLVILKDVTDLEEAQLQLRQSQKMEAIGTLAGGVAHDFNNILTVIRGHAEMGLMQVAADSREFIDFTAIEQASARAKSLTSQLLAFSRKQRIRPQLIMIDKALSDLNKMLRRLIGEDITLNTSWSGDLLPIFVDPGQLDQVIINLVINAVDAIRSNDNASVKLITISVSMVILDDSFALKYPGSSAGKHLLLEISDTGKGMSPEIMERIFEPFYTTKEQGKGTGLGLSTVYGIVKQNNGYIDVSSELGQGASFKIYWPVNEELSEAEAGDNAPDPLSSFHGDETILLVEDEVSVRVITQKSLRIAGYNVIAAENGAAALEKLEETGLRPDLLFTDVVMPKMNGRELAEKISTLYPEVEILFTSGYFDNDIWDDSSIPAQSRFLEKPYEQYKLLKKIRELLDE